MVFQELEVLTQPELQDAFLETKNPEVRNNPAVVLGRNVTTPCHVPDLCLQSWLSVTTKYRKGRVSL